jgi:hypothetical protein
MFYIPRVMSDSFTKQQSTLLRVSKRKGYELRSVLLFSFLALGLRQKSLKTRLFGYMAHWN